MVALELGVKLIFAKWGVQKVCVTTALCNGDTVVGPGPDVGVIEEENDTVVTTDPSVVNTGVFHYTH